MKNMLFTSEAMIKALAQRLTELLRDEFSLDVSEANYHFEDVKKLELRYLTSLLGIEGEVQVLVLFSFDEVLIQYIFKIYAADLDIEADEQAMMLEETSGDLLNIVVGNVLAAFSQKGVSTSFSPPITLTEAKNIVRHKEAMFNVAELTTPQGVVSIFCVAPKSLFDQQLNYVETE